MRRIIPLEKGRNFRDLGGYATDDGRRTRWGKVFRSGVMSYLTDRDHESLRPFDIRTVCDFRSTREREREPISWCSGKANILHWDYDASTFGSRSFLTGVEFSPEVSRSTMRMHYRKMPVQFKTQYAGLFERLAAGDLSLVFNCSAGKDRTGLAAALLLLTLGVSKGEVTADYVLTDATVDLEQELFAHTATSFGLGDDLSQLRAFSREARLPLLQALPEYLDAALEQIETDYGSVPRYVRNVLGVDEDKLERIRSRLLES